MMSSAKQGAIQGTIYVILGAVPILWMIHMYFLPISWLGKILC